LQSGWTANTTLPTGGSFNVCFQGFQTGNAVNVKTILLCGQMLPAVVNQVQYYPDPAHVSDMVGGKIIASNAVGLPTLWYTNSTMPKLNLNPYSTGSSNQFVTLATITSATAGLNILPIANTTPYRWIAYMAAPGACGHVEKVDFYSGNYWMHGNEFSSFPDVSTTARIATNIDLPASNAIYWGYNHNGVYAGIDTLWDTTAYWPGIAPLPSVRVYASTINPQPFIYSGTSVPVSVTLNNWGAPNATVRYTLDGSIPTATNGTVYTGPFTLNQTTTVEAASIEPDLADSPAFVSTYLINTPTHPLDQPQRNSFHIGNSLTQATSAFDMHAATAGDPHTQVIFGIGGSETINLWKAKNNIIDTDPGYTGDPNPNYQNWLNTWGSITTTGIQNNLTDFTLQPRDFANNNEDEEAQYDLLWLNFVQSNSPNVQPWLYAEWTEFNRQRPTDLGTQSTYQMTTPYPALTWEESMGAMLLYNEDVLTKVNQTYTGNKPIRILPVGIAMGWLHNMIQNGTFPLTSNGLAPGDFYTQFFWDQVHPNAEGAFLVEMVWYSAFYGQSPVGKVLSVLTNLTPAQATAMETLAWNVVSNYPRAGVYAASGSPAAAPTFSQTGHVTVNTPITLSSTTSGAWFRYTLDGTTPTDTKGYVYCGVITVRPGMTVKAIAYKNGMTPSSVSSTTY